MFKMMVAPFRMFVLVTAAVSLSSCAIPIAPVRVERCVEPRDGPRVLVTTMEKTSIYTVFANLSDIGFAYPAIQGSYWFFKRFEDGKPERDYSRSEFLASMPSKFFLVTTVMSPLRSYRSVSSSQAELTFKSIFYIEISQLDKLDYEVTVEDYDLSTWAGRELVVLGFDSGLFSTQARRIRLEPTGYERDIVFGTLVKALRAQ